MTTDLMLRFDTEEQAISALPMLRSEDAWITASHCHALDPIGPVVTTPAVLDDAGEVVTPAVMDTRFHANLRLLPGADPAIAAAATPFAVTPADPARVWA